MPAIRAEASTSRNATRKKADGPSDPCPICQTRVARQSDLKRHMKKHDSFENKTYRCPHCNYRSSVKCAFSAHVNIHDGILQHCKVEGCNAQFSDKASLSRHHTKVHKTDQEKKRRKTSQLPETVRKTRAPATVRRTVEGDANKAYSQFSKFPTTPQPPSSFNADIPSSPSTLSELTDSDQDSITMPPTPKFSTSPQSDMAAFHLLNEQQYLSSELVEHLKLASSCSERDTFKNEWDIAPASRYDIPATSSLLHPNYALTGFYGSVPFEPYISMALQDFSYDVPTELDSSFPTSNAFSMGLGNTTPFMKDEYSSSNINPAPLSGNGLYDFYKHQTLTPDGLFPLFQPQITESSPMAPSGFSPYPNYQTTQCADPMNSFQPWTQAPSFSELLDICNSPPQYQNFQWSTEAPVPGHIF